MRTLSPLLNFPISRFAIALLFAFAMTVPAICGPIHDAAEAGDSAKVKALLQIDATLVRSKDNIGSTPLHEAAFFGHREVVELLLANGADIDAKNNYGTTPLLWAAQKGQKDVAELLLAKGADVNAMDKDGVSPLINAVLNGHQDVVELLLAKGADINASEADGTTALSAAAENSVALSANDRQKRAAIRVLLVKTLDDSVGPPKNLIDAVNRGDAVAVSGLLQRGVPVNVKRIDSSTPLILAARYGDLAIVKILLAKGADVNARSSADETALYWAVLKGQADIRETLLAKGADVNAGWKDGETALMVASERGDLSMMQEFLAKGANVNAVNKYGATALYLASLDHHIDAVRELLTKGADPNKRVTFQNSFWRLRTCLARASYDGDIEVVEALLAKGADVNAIAIDDEGSTALQEASERGHLEIVRDLLAKGADVNAKRRDGKTALVLAHQGGLGDVMQTLIAKGADSTSVPSGGITRTFDQVFDPYLIDAERALKSKGYYNGDIGILDVKVITEAFKKFQLDGNITEGLGFPFLPITDKALGITFNPDRLCFWYKSTRGDGLYCPPEANCKTAMMMESSVQNGGMSSVRGYQVSCPGRKDEILALPPKNWVSKVRF